jgi:uncharacterized protein (DUF924 family)
VAKQAHWQDVYGFWFPPDLDQAGLPRHLETANWWMCGGASSELSSFNAVVEQARRGQLDHWADSPMGRLSLILVLDQFTRGLFAGTSEAFASDAAALRIAEEGLRNGHYDSLSRPWERCFFRQPLLHAEGADHLDRIHRAIAAAEDELDGVPRHLLSLYAFKLSQARRKWQVVHCFGRLPGRNEILGRISTAEEIRFLQVGEFDDADPLPVDGEPVG